MSGRRANLLCMGGQHGDRGLRQRSGGVRSPREPSRSSWGETQRTILGWVGFAGVLAAATLLVVLAWPGGWQLTSTWSTSILGLFAGGAALISAAAGLASVATARRALGQQLYELARATHQDLTSGDVAAARDRLGTLVRARRRLWSGPPEPNSTWDSEVRKAYDLRGDGEAMDRWRRDWFTLLWCFERVHAALVLLAQTPPELVAAGQQSPRDFLADLVRTQVRFLNTDAADIRAALEEHYRDRVDDGESTSAFRELVTELLPGMAPGRWADAVSTEHGEVLLALLLERRDEVVRVRHDLALADLRPDQLDALLGAVAPPDRQRHDERTTIADRLRAEAQQLEQRANLQPDQPPEPRPNPLPDERRRRNVSGLRDRARAFAAELPGEESHPTARQSAPDPGNPRAEP